MQLDLFSLWHHVEGELFPPIGGGDGPSTDSKTLQERGPRGPEERQMFGVAQEQSALGLESLRGSTRDAQTRLASFASDDKLLQDKIAQAKNRIATIELEWQTSGYRPEYPAEREDLTKQISILENQREAMAANKPVLSQQAQREQRYAQYGDESARRVMDIISGKDLGVSAEERALITQGISGISQDVATTRGLNRSDVPVMQAVAPTVANALLQQANANRSLFTGINQFQQGMDLSGRQLQAGLAGQNPAANLTGVYAGLRPSSFSTNTQQGYGALDYVNATANLAQAAGTSYAGFTGGLKGK